MFGAIIVMALAPWLDTSSVRSARYRPMLKWWFGILVFDFNVVSGDASLEFSSVQ